MTRRRFVRVEELLGQRVEDREGRRVGRIEEIRAERHGKDHEVTEYLLGPGALVERLAMTMRGRPRTIIVRWDQLDITNPRRPRLTCDRSELVERRPGGRDAGRSRS